MADPTPKLNFGTPRFPDARDLSDYLVHLTNSEASLAAILIDGHLEARNPFGLGRLVEETRRRHMAVCLSETPLAELSRIAKQKGKWGIAFSQDFIKRVGGQRVWYLDEGSSGHLDASATMERVRLAGDWTHPFWSLTPFIDRVIPGVYDFPHEREWRVRGGFHFSWEDIALLIIPTGEVMSFEFKPELASRTYNPHDAAYEWWGGTLPALNRRMDEMLEQFTESYANPSEHLFYDPEDYYGYGWGGFSAVETEDGVDDLFGEILQNVRDVLVDHLNSLSPVWLSQLELDEDAKEHRQTQEETTGDADDGGDSVGAPVGFGFTL